MGLFAGTFKAYFDHANIETIRQTLTETRTTQTKKVYSHMFNRE
jgi:hypothetical protein